MSKPTQADIDREIAALKALKPTGVRASRTARMIQAAVDTLTGQVDSTTPEFHEQDWAEKDVFMTTRSWMDGGDKDPPSLGWDGLVEDKNAPANHVPDNTLKTVCKAGKGADCCRYLTAGPYGFECAKHTGLKSLLDERVRTGAITTQGDNCPGLPLP